MSIKVQKRIWIECKTEEDFNVAIDIARKYKVLDSECDHEWSKECRLAMDILGISNFTDTKTDHKKVTFIKWAKACFNFKAYTVDMRTVEFDYNSGGKPCVKVGCCMVEKDVVQELADLLDNYSDIGPEDEEEYVTVPVGLKRGCPE